MDVSVSSRWLRIGVLLIFVGMVAVNALANALPLNGVNTGQVSALYPNLFTPAPYTFGIWGLIYLMLAVYTGFQVLGRSVAEGPRRKMLTEVAKLFIGTSILNAGWIFAWHYGQMALTAVLMLGLLIGLARIGWLLRTPHCSPVEELALRIPFALYFGWITVATVANITVLLVHLQWDGFGIAAPIWTALILTVASVIAAVTMYRIRSVAYGLAVVWAFVGILVRQTSANGLQGMYPLVTGFTVALLVGLVGMLIPTAIHMRRSAACEVQK